jgi:hypothetical protein
VVIRLSDRGMDRVLGAAAEAGLLGADRFYEMPDVYDLWTAVFIVNAAGSSHRISAYGLGFAGEADLVSAPDLEARKQLSAFLAHVTDLGNWIGAPDASAEEPYAPASTRVFVAPDVAWADPGATPAPVTAAPGQDVRPWPLDVAPELFGAGSEGNWRCAALSAPDDPFDLATATFATRWQVGDRLYRIIARPLLPDESGCAAAV